MGCSCSSTKPNPAATPDDAVFATEVEPVKVTPEPEPEPEPELEPEKLKPLMYIEGETLYRRCDSAQQLFKDFTHASNVSAKLHKRDFMEYFHKQGTGSRATKHLFGKFDTKNAGSITFMMFFDNIFLMSKTVEEAVSSEAKDEAKDGDSKESPRNSGTGPAVSSSPRKSMSSSPRKSKTPDKVSRISKPQVEPLSIKTDSEASPRKGQSSSPRRSGGSPRRSGGSPRRSGGSPRRSGSSPRKSGGSPRMSGTKPVTPKQSRTSPRMAKTSSPRGAKTSSPRGAKTSSPRQAKTSSPRGAKTSSPRRAKVSPRQAKTSSPRNSRTSPRTSTRNSRISPKASNSTGVFGAAFENDAKESGATNPSAQDDTQVEAGPPVVASDGEATGTQ